MKRIHLLFAVAFLAITSAPVAALTPDEVSSLRARALDHFYNLEYSEAIPLFEQLRDAEPQRAAWHNHVAMSYFYELLHRAGVLQGDLFGASNRFFRTRRITPDPLMAERFHRANSTAIALCEGQLKQAKDDQAALYSCGVAYAARATYQGLVQRALLDSLGSARRANDFHSRLIRANPKFFDAYLVPGLYDFLVGSLPKAAKFFLFFGGVTGNKQRGIEKAEMVVQSGESAKHDARILLTVMYRREKRFADALRTMQTLANLFPRNYIFPLEIASLHRAAGEAPQAIQQYEQVLERISLGAAGYDRAPTARIHFELGHLYRQIDNHEAALSHLREVPTSKGTSPELDREAAALIQQISDAQLKKSASR